MLSFRVFASVFWKKIRIWVPIWLLVLSLIFFLQIGSLAFTPAQSADLSLSDPPAAGRDAIKPAVLGVSTELRGSPRQNSQPSLVQTIDDTDITAQSYIVQDIESGKILAERNPEQKLAIASLTKLMTGLLAYERMDRSAVITVTSRDQLEVSPNLKLKTGDQVTVEDLFNSMLVGSANDAALALANHMEEFSAKRFTELMNERAALLGMKNSHFSNPLGFESTQNFSTASDLLLLISEIQTHSAFTNLGRTLRYSFTSALGNTYFVSTTNKLLKLHSEIEAVKTGYTEQSGESMAVKAADQKGHKIIIIVLGSENREADTLRLEKRIFEKIEWK